MASGGVVDALPYVDQEYDIPVLRETAQKLIEEEMKRYRPAKNYLDYLPVPTASFITPVVQGEMDRLSSRQPMETLSMKRYELPQPGAMQKNDVSAWQESTKNSSAQLEHQRCRIDNLELLADYGTAEWRLYNKQLSQIVDVEAQRLKEVRNQVREVNWQRKTEQTAVGGQLASLSNHWNALVYKNFEIELQCCQLMSQAAQYRQRTKELEMAAAAAVTTEEQST